MALGGEARLELLVERDELGDERGLAGDDLRHLHDVLGAARLDDLEARLADVRAQRFDRAVELVHAPRDRRLARTCASYASQASAISAR